MNPRGRICVNEEGQRAVEGQIDSVFYTQRPRRRGLFRGKGK